MLTQHLKTARHAAAFLVTRGIGDFARETRYRVVECYHENRLGIRTAERVILADIGIDSADSRDSMPIGYAALLSALRRLPIAAQDCVFLDYGVGTGRAACVASTFPFRRVIGIDISDTLITMAQANLARLRHRRADRVEFYNIDAARYVVPPDVNLIYFFNPFAGETLRQVLANIAASIQVHPRRLFIVFFNNDHFEQVAFDARTWLAKIHQTEFYPRISCGIYETRIEGIRA